GVQGNKTVRITNITHDIAEAVKGADIIFLIIPSMFHHIYADILFDQLTDGQHLAILPGTFGALDMYNRMRHKGLTAGIIISESDAMPYAARRQGGNKIHIYNKLPEFGLGTFPAKFTAEATEQVKKYFPAATPLKNVLEAGLNNANPALHPLGVLLNVGRIEYAKGNFYYYEEGFTESVANAINVLDKERLALGKILGLNLPDLATGLQSASYGPKGDLWETINGSRALTPISGPTSVSNRYLTEDIPIGLNMWSSLAKQFNLPTPLIDATIAIGEVVCKLDKDVYRRNNVSCGIDRMSVNELNDYVVEGE
ncbi:MAG: NAD/NADP octopine/nopaline dehydrogenase family protein, partial [Victivallales bacterium]